MSEDPKPCPFCGGPARTYNDGTQATCAVEGGDCAGSDVHSPVWMWNARATPNNLGREAIARIIDHQAFLTVEEMVERYRMAPENRGKAVRTVHNRDGRRTEALRKADQILALSLASHSPTEDRSTEREGPAAVALAEIEAFAARQYEMSNGKGPEWQRKAHAGAYAGAFTSAQILRAAIDKAGDQT